MRFIVFFLFTIFLFNCTISDIDNPNEEKKESCDFGICEDGRNALDTLIDVHGVLRKKNSVYYLEVTGNAPEPDTLFISCISEGIIFPEEGSYVKCNGIIKEPCSLEISTSKDSMLLQKLEEIIPIEDNNCNKKIISEGYDVKKIDEELRIHHLKLEDNCLFLLVSYMGNCNQLPALTLHNGGDIMFGNGAMINVNLQGEIQSDCDVENYVVLQFDISPLRDILIYPTDDFTLYFQSQGYLRIG